MGITGPSLQMEAAETCSRSHLEGAKNRGGSGWVHGASGTKSASLSAGPDRVTGGTCVTGKGSALCPRPPAVGARSAAVADPGEEVSPQASSFREGAVSGDTEVRSPTGYQASSTSSTPQKIQCLMPKVPIFLRPDHGPQWEDQTLPWVFPPALGPQG